MGSFSLYGSTGVIGKTKTATHDGNIVLVARVGSIGKVQYINEPCGVSDNTLIVDAGNECQYIYHYLRTYDFTRITSGTTQPLITASSLKKIEIPYFEKDKRIHIVNVLNAVEAVSNTEREALSNYILMKQYLLRQMFI